MNGEERLKGLRVLVMEDEALVSFLIEDILEDLGCVVAASAARVTEGLALLAEHGRDGLDAAILDVNLAGEQVYPLAEALEDAGVPFAFASGYGAGIDPRWALRPTLQKPYVADDIRTALLTLLKPRPTA